jgi:transcriptional regulator with XRE-family HTH domain
MNRLIPPDGLARRIRMIMGDQKISRKRLAAEAKISRPSLASKVDGRVPFTYNEVLRVIEVLGVSMEILLDDEEEEDGPIRLKDFGPHPDRSL